MGLLGELGKGQGYLRAGFLGFQSSGKTMTAVKLACGLYRHFGLKGRIAMFDTEGGSEYIAGIVKRETGQSLLGVKSQSFQDLMDMKEECLASGVEILLVDSVTHIWREICDSYLEHVNADRAKRNMSPRTKLEFQDWGPIKKKWADWTMSYLNDPLHMIICGRAGFEYENEKNEETGKRELIKVGTKMKTETEFGFEPSLLVEMERVEIHDEHTVKTVHRATINKDRFDVMDGLTCDDPTFEFFLPHVSRLKPGAHSEIRQQRTPMTIDEQGRSDWERVKNRRVKAWEEIENGLAILYPSSQGKDKQARFLIYQALTGTVSETKIQGLPPEQLELMALAVSDYGKEVLAGLVVEGPAVGAYVRAIYDRLAAEHQARHAEGLTGPAQPTSTPTPEPSQTPEPNPAPSKETPPQEDPLMMLTREINLAEGALSKTMQGRKALAILRQGLGVPDGYLPLLDEDIRAYHAQLQVILDRFLAQNPKVKPAREAVGGNGR